MLVDCLVTLLVFLIHYETNRVEIPTVGVGWRNEMSLTAWNREQFEEEQKSHQRMRTFSALFVAAKASAKTLERFSSRQSLLMPEHNDFLRSLSV